MSYVKQRKNIAQPNENKSSEQIIDELLIKQVKKKTSCRKT